MKSLNRTNKGELLSEGHRFYNVVYVNQPDSCCLESAIHITFGLCFLFSTIE